MASWVSQTRHARFTGVSAPRAPTRKAEVQARGIVRLSTLERLVDLGPLARTRLRALASPPARSLSRRHGRRPGVPAIVRHGSNPPDRGQRRPPHHAGGASSPWLGTPWLKRAMGGTDSTSFGWPARTWYHDLVMPEIEGLEVVRQLRNAPSPVNIIAISGGGRASAAVYLEAARLLGASRVLHKPFTAAVLLAASTSCCRATSEAAVEDRDTTCSIRRARFTGSRASGANPTRPRCRRGELCGCHPPRA